jgi:hypothetical protein
MSSTVNVRSHVNGLHVPLSPDVAPKIVSLYRSTGGNDLIFDKKSLIGAKPTKKTVVKIADESVNAADLA